MTDVWTYTRNLVVAAGIAALAALVFNAYLTPWAADWFFSRMPIERVAEWERSRTRTTRKIATGLFVEMIGPSGPKPGDTERREAGRDGTGADAGPERVEAPPPKERPAETGRGEPSGGAEGVAGDEGEPPAGDGRADGGEVEVPEEPLAFEIDRRELNRHLRKPEAVRKSVSVVEHRSPKGLRVERLDGYFGQFGLRAGDVVLSIDDTRVPTRRRAITYVMRNRRKESFRLKVRRAGRTFRIRYSVPVPE